jgi:hypothetical protein
MAASVTDATGSYGIILAGTSIEALTQHITVVTESGAAHLVIH